MAKKKNVTVARRAFVQSRASATGKTSAEDRAKFRERFEKLASTKEGRAKIQEVTQIQGVRKALASEYGKKSTKTKTTTVTIPGFGVAGSRRETEGQMESRLRANPTPYKTTLKQPTSEDVRFKNIGSRSINAQRASFRRSENLTPKASSGRSVLGQIFDAQAAVGKQLEKVTKYTRKVTNPFTSDDPPKTGIPTLSEYPKMIADAASVGGLGKAVNLAAKPALTFGKTTFRTFMGSSPKLKAPTTGPINRAVNQPRPGSRSSTLSRPKTASGVKTSNKKTSKKR